LRELVLALAKRTQLTVAPFLGRRRYTRSQTRLPRERRVRNPRGSFRLRRGVVVPDHVILIDDVVTTGATVSEAARMLRKGGAQRIDVLAVARSCGP
jgi:predicted amidophosphoribosyltransferase